MTRQQSIRVVLPDTGPLISLALGESLDLLLAVASDMRLVLTDVVEFEATHRADDLPDAQAIRAFLRSHADRIEVMPTTIGSIALADLQRKAEAGLPAALPKDLGELSITNFVMSLRTANPGDPMLVIIADGLALKPFYRAAAANQDSSSLKAASAATPRSCAAQATDSGTVRDAQGHLDMDKSTPPSGSGCGCAGGSG
jgi:hypothetical protein